MPMIYIMCHDGGCEGFSAPIQAFQDEETAIGALRLANGGADTSMVLFEVPVWPATMPHPYYEMEPIVFDREGKRV